MKELKLTKKRTKFILVRNVNEKDKSWAIIKIGRSFLCDLEACEQAMGQFHERIDSFIRLYDRHYMQWLPEEYFDNESFEEIFNAKAVGEGEISYAYLKLTNEEYEKIENDLPYKYRKAVTMMEFSNYGDFSFRINVVYRHDPDMPFHEFESCQFCRDVLLG